MADQFVESSVSNPGCVVVNRTNQPIAAWDKSVVHDQLALHRTAHVLILSAGQVLIQKRPLSKRVFSGMWDISAAGHTRWAETPKETALRETYEEIGLKLSECDLLPVLDFLPARENGFEFCSVFVAHIKSPLSLLNLRCGCETLDLSWVSPNRLVKKMILEPCLYTQNLFQTMSILGQYYLNVDLELCLKLAEIANTYYALPGMSKYLPSYEVTAINQSDKARFAEKFRRRGLQPFWHELVALYQNQRPYYPAKNGLEVGAILLDEIDIYKGIEAILRTELSNIQSVVIVAKWRSGERIAAVVEQLLRTMGVTTTLVPVNTTWQGHWNVMLEANLMSAISCHDIYLVCDLMISSGATMGAIQTFLTAQGIPDDRIVFLAAVNVERPRSFQPKSLYYITTYYDNDWFVGFGADARSVDHHELCRGWPFIATLKPRGQGARDFLMSLPGSNDG